MSALPHLALAALLGLLAACATHTPQERLQGDADPKRWKAHSEQIKAINAWQISGKLGVRTPAESGSATLFWLQRNDYFDIRLAGPLGQGAARLHGHHQQVTLALANQGQYSAASPEALLEERLGWRLPVSHLLWWIRGLPAPDSPSQLTLDSDSRLSQLSQDGWDIRYTRYQPSELGDLPTRLTLSGHDINITLVIKEWQPRLLGR